jgi:hypothetical protein
VEFKKGLAAAGAVVVAAGAGGAMLAHASNRAQKTEGGLAVSPSMVERKAQAGATDTFTVSNNSDKALNVKVAARPWIQGSSGAVAPNRRHALGTVGVSAPSFTLAPKQSKTLTVMLKTGSPTYGSVEVIGLPTDASKSKGIVLGYRVLSTLRYDPATAVHALKAGSVKISKSKLSVGVRNTGNTVDPVTGTVSIKGSLGTKQGSIKSTRILPGKTISIPVTSAKHLAKGSYTATIQLTQGTSKIKLTKKFRVK